MRSLNPPASTHQRPLLVSLVATRLVKDLFGVGITHPICETKNNPVLQQSDKFLSRMFDF
jgi:hypothetical protein